MDNIITVQEANALVDDFSFIYKGKSISKEATIECREIIHKALEKQIPKEPKIIKYESEYDTRDYFCPICNKCFIHFLDGEFYAGKKDCWCSECGQKINWSECND